MLEHWHLCSRSTSAKRALLVLSALASLATTRHSQRSTPPRTICWRSQFNEGAGSTQQDAAFFIAQGLVDLEAGFWVFAFPVCVGALYYVSRLLAIAY